MISFRDPHQALVGLHDMLTGWQSIRGRRRMRYSPPEAASPSPPVSMHSPPVAGAPPDLGPPGSEKATVIAYRKLGDRIVPIFGDPAEFGDAAHASANGVPSPSEARATEAPAPQAPPQAAPDASSEPISEHSPQTPPPPDFTPQAVEASAPRRSPAAAPILDLPPPTPPSLVRVDEQAVTLERVLADHRTLLARQTEAQQTQHAAMMEAILAEHRRAQAQADHEHRQQLGELLAKHREDVQRVAETTGEHGQALVNVRELLADQVSAMQAEHARIGEKIESIVDIVGMVGETVHHIAAVALQPKPTLFGALPTRPVDTSPKGVPDRPMQASPPPAVTGAARILPVRPPMQPGSPPEAVATIQPPDQAAPQPTPTVAPPVAVPQPTPTVAPPDAAPQPTPTITPPVAEPQPTPMVAPPVAAPQPTPTVAPPVAAPQPTPTVAPPVAAPQSTPAGATPDVTRRHLAAVPPRGEHGPTSVMPPATTTATGHVAASAGGSTSSRSPGFMPAASAILTLTSTQPLTPRQLRAEAAARERSRLDEAVSDLTLDDSADPGDGPDESEVSDV